MQHDAKPLANEPARLTLADAKAQFAAASTPSDLRRQALSVLVGEKFLPKQADEPLVREGRSHLLRVARAANASAPAEQLLAIAESVRLGQVVKRWAPEIAVQLAPAFVAPLPPMGMLPDAEDRLNLARACAAANADWLPAWMARAIAEEETGEKPRAELLAALATRVSSLAEMLQRLVSAFEVVRPQTEAPGDALARRLTRTLAAWREILRDSELPAGDGLGVALHDLLAMPLSETGKPQLEKVQLDLCEQALLSVHDSVRTRISLAADPDIYKVVAYCRRLCGGRDWPKALARPVQRLVADVSEALLLLGRQGQRDQALLGQLQVLSNNGEGARVTARTLAQQHPELPEAVRDWLTLGHVPPVSTASASAEAAAQANADGSVGLALAASRQLRTLRDSLQGPLRETLDLYEPTLLPATARLLDSAQAVAVLVEQVATLRDLTLLGAPGEEVEANPKFFEVLGQTPRLRMTVKQPAVVRLRLDRSVGEVVVKGLVE